jgi:MoaA/NifB/PqqE/SkfB family radical SAM enzyme
MTGEETCRAPSVSFRLEPTGSVQACCVNDEYPLGSITDASLRSIWRGARFERLRTAMDEADFSLGCQGCGDPRALGLRSQTLAVDYDHFDETGDGAWPRHIEFALSNTCNLQCVQCNGELSSSIRAQREHRPPLRSPYDDAFFDELVEFLPHLEAATFIGGEPFLMRECRRVWDLLLELDDPPEVWVTTNGTVWDDRVEHYLHGLKMGVSLSIDGVEPATIEAIRVGADAEALLANRDRFLAATRSYGRGMKLNYCVMPQNWREFLPFLLDAEELGVPVYAARVQRPAEHSLYRLPVAELRVVVDAMSEQGAAHVHELELNRPAWDGTLAELTAHLAGIEAATTAREPSFVPVEAPRRSREPFDATLARWSASLGEAGGSPPAHVTIRSGRVDTVDAPEWADFLGLDELVGVGQADMFPTIERRLGAAQSVPVPVAGEEDLFGTTCVLALGDTLVELHSVAIEEDAGCTHVLVGLVPTAPRS